MQGFLPIPPMLCLEYHQAVQVPEMASIERNPARLATTSLQHELGYLFVRYNFFTDAN